MTKKKDGTEKELEQRSPVVAILGHIDHGKSTLIDYIRKSNVTATEAGGITQHISAYEITHNLKDGRSKRITLLDTPGHEAFSSIRTRCANVADIAVLIVSAEDGVKPQTMEVIKHIKECPLPFIVAISKVDKPTADILRTKQGLAESGVYVEGYGGDTPVVEISAKTGEGVDELLDLLSLMSEMENKTAEREALGSGVIIETRRDSKRGITAVGIIQNGTVRQGLFAASAGSIAPMRFLLDAEGNVVEELSFSSPVQIVGWDQMPVIGEAFQTFLKKEEALAFANENKSKIASNGLEKVKGEVSILPLIIKADTAGSLEAIKGELAKLSRERIVPKVISSGVGTINENDVKSALSSTTKAVIIGFSVKADTQALHLAERSGIEILLFSIIYELTDKVKELLLEKEPRIEVEEIVGSFKVLRLFGITKGKQIIGGRVISGQIKSGAGVNIVRRESEIGSGKVRELQQSKIATESVGEGLEFGAMIESKIEVAPGDTLNATVLVTK